MTLIGGDPGIGKSTLMLQSAAALTAAAPSLYATGEESLKQVGLRARRLGLDSAGTRLIAETQVEAIVEAAKSLKKAIQDNLRTLQDLSAEELLERRQERWVNYGKFKDLAE